MCEAGKGTAKIKVGLEMKLINIKRFDFGQELRENQTGIVLPICAKFDNEQAKDTGVIEIMKLVILQTN